MAQNACAQTPGPPCVLRKCPASSGDPAEDREVKTSVGEGLSPPTSDSGAGAGLSSAGRRGHRLTWIYAHRKLRAAAGTAAPVRVGALRVWTRGQGLGSHLWSPGSVPASRHPGLPATRTLEVDC